MIKIILLLFFLFSFECGALIDLDEAKTKYPIVLVHGILGEPPGLGKYWGNLPDILSLNGAKVYIAKLSRAHTPQQRGKQLGELFFKWGHEKYHIIGHSQGGLDSRVLSHTHSYMIASILTISTPHQGSCIADAVYNLVDKIPFSSVIWTMGNWVCHGISFSFGEAHEQDLRQAVKALTTADMDKFNKEYPQGISIPTNDRLYSVGFCCGVPHGITDVAGILMGIAGYLFFAGEQNDGMVAIKSMNFGVWLGELCGAHHLLPVKGGLAPYQSRTIDEFLTIILNYVRHLKEMGL
jgi:triacylglycerol lipase